MTFIRRVTTEEAATGAEQQQQAVAACHSVISSQDPPARVKPIYSQAAREGETDLSGGHYLRRRIATEKEGTQAEQQQSGCAVGAIHT